jgi:hypothetical protein
VSMMRPRASSNRINCCCFLQFFLVQDENGL